MSTRSLNPDHLVKLREGRERYLRTQAKRDAQLVSAYKDWCVEERRAFQRFATLRDAMGHDADLTEAARKKWQEILADMPETPADSSPAWRGRVAA